MFVSFVYDNIGQQLNMYYWSIESV